MNKAGLTCGHPLLYSISYIAEIHVKVRELLHINTEILVR